MASIEHLQLIESIIEASPAMIFRWVIQDDWPVEYVSNNVSQLGYTPEEMFSGQISWPGITHPEDSPRLEQEVSEHLEAGTTQWSQTYRIRRRDGSYRWVRDWNLLLLNDQGEPGWIQGIVIEITREKVEMEKRIAAERDLQDALAEVVAGFVPICSDCKAIRDGAGRWVQLETFLNRRSPVQFTHGCCPACLERFESEADTSEGEDTPDG